MRTQLCLWLVPAIALIVLDGLAGAQPLVTGDLSIYYDFEDFVDEVEDQSNNGVMQVNADIVGNIVRSELAARGNGAAHFRPDIPNTEAPDIKDFFPDDYLDADGPSIDPSLVPSTGFTVATWVNLVRYSELCDPSCAKDQNHSMLGSRSSGGAFVNHFEARSDGKLRGRIRGDTNSDDIVKMIVFTDGTTDSGAEWPDNEWMHIAQTYDATANGGLGEWAYYYNGVQIAGGVANGNAGAVAMGDWQLGLNIGRDQDEDRQLNGWMDEYYVFTRALSGAEIATLANLDPADILRGDTDLNDKVDFDDIDPFVLALTRPELYDSDFTNLAFGHPASAQADMDGNGRVDFDDIQGFVDRLSSGAFASGVPEPSTCVLTLVSLIGLMVVARRRRR